MTLAKPYTIIHARLNDKTVELSSDHALVQGDFNNTVFVIDADTVHGHPFESAFISYFNDGYQNGYRIYIIFDNGIQKIKTEYMPYMLVPPIVFATNGKLHVYVNVVAPTIEADNGIYV